VFSDDTGVFDKWNISTEIYVFHPEVLVKQ